MLSSVAGVFVGDMALPEPWNHRVMMIAAVCAALSGFMVQHPVPDRDRVWSDAERAAHRNELGI